MSQGSPTFGLDDVVIGTSIALGSAGIGIDGMIIATSSTYCSFEASVHAIVENGSANGGYDGSPWPTARGNRGNTARAGG